MIVQSLKGKDRTAPADSLGHEFGHVFDIIAGRKNMLATEEKAKLFPHLSHSQLYADAYNFDLRNVPSKYNQALSYYMQPDRAGQEELFAEMFPLLYGRPVDNLTYRGQRLALLKESFPSVLQIMRSTFNIYD